MEQIFKNSISLLNIKGIPDKNLSQEITRPIIMEIPKYYPYKPIDFDRCDTIKIKGLILDKTKIDELVYNYKHLEILFGSQSYYKIPFHFLINSMKNIDETNCFIEFPHDYLFGHLIQIFNMKYHKLEIKIGNDSVNRNFDVLIVLEAGVFNKNNTICNLIDIKNIQKDIRNNLPNMSNVTKVFDSHIETIEFNIRNIQPFELLKTTDNTFENYVEPDFLTQGILIDASIKNICGVKIIILNNTTNGIIEALDYNFNLINIYGEQVGQFTYLGFNPNENFTSTNLVGCINMSRVDKVRIIVYTYNCGEKLIVYMPNWNTLAYSHGLVAIRYSR